MMRSIRHLCWKFDIPRFTARRHMSEKGKDQAMKFEIGTGDKKMTYEAVDVQKKANTFYNWFSTLKGQKVVGSVWIGLSAFGALYHVAPHWFFLDQVRSVYQSYSKGFKTPVRNELLELLNVVIKDMDLNDKDVETLSVFVINSTEPFGWGELGKNSMVGVPDYLHYQHINEVPLDKIRIGIRSSGDESGFLSPVQVESETGKLFADSMVLSDKAKKFAIAKEIERTRMQPFMLHGVFSFAFTLLTYNMARIINKQMEMFKKPPLLRGMMYIGLLPTMVLSYFITKDAYNRYTDKMLDRRAASISTDYSQGGVEYYNKQLQRNIALREFLGDAGSSMYTSRGDIVQGILRVKTANISERRDVCASQYYVKAS